MASGGYTPAEIDEMSLHDVAELFAYWREFPPVHEILKHVYKIGQRRDTGTVKSINDPSGIGSLIARFPDGFVRAERI